MLSYEIQDNYSPRNIYIYIYISGHENYVMRLHTSRLVMIPNPKYVPGHMSINWALIFCYDQHT